MDVREALRAWVTAVACLVAPAVVLAQAAEGAPTPGDDAAASAPADAGMAAGDATGSDAAASGDEANLLDAGAEEEGGDLLSGEGEGQQGKDEGASFGAILEGFGLAAEISGYGETVFYIDGEKLSFDMWHFVPIIGVQIGNNARAEVEMEFEHGGSEKNIEYAFFEYVPYRALALRVGKFNVPFGYFNAVLHPSFKWNQISRPAMMDNVVPTTWNEVGAQLYGRAELGPTSAFEYNLWLTNGLGYSEGTDLTEKAAFVRKFMRDNVRDNNTDKAVGARVGLRALAGGGKVKILSGLSFYTSAVDPAGSERLTLLGYDLWVQAGDFMLRGEFAHSFWNDASSTAIQPLERGSYVETAYALGQWELAVRWDNTFLKPGMGPVELHNQIVPSLKFAPDPLWSVRAEVALPLFVTYTGIPRIDFMINFSF
ncbi:MAG: hypothetical protein D6729_11880 [Deltaproteobacteria bacterium]|nr:MAG: hypothetical protein D6729_11880 [Deltaproteobacteria bacterium]